MQNFFHNIQSLYIVRILFYVYIYIYILDLKNKSMAYSSQGSHTGQLDFCNWLADGSTMG